MVNRHRGEISAELDGRARTLCLTLGALAELEAALGDEDMLALATRFEAGRLRATDAIAILGAGLRGAGEDIDDAEVATLKVDGGASGYVGIVSDLLQATFAPVDAGDDGGDTQSKKKI